MGFRRMLGGGGLGDCGGARGAEADGRRRKRIDGGGARWGRAGRTILEVARLSFSSQLFAIL